MKRLFSITALAVILAARAKAQPGTTYTLGVLVPAGDLHAVTGAGFGFGIRSSGGFNYNYGFRIDAGLDFFNTSGEFKSHLYQSIAANLTHGVNSPVYEFAGLGLYVDRQTLNAKNNPTRSLYNFGGQGGIGYKLTWLKWPRESFVEIGVNTMFTPGERTFWFPVRFGIIDW